MPDNPFRIFEDFKNNGIVYFMECKGFIKIGRCKYLNLDYRRGELQGGNPFDLEVLGIIICESESGARGKERDLQKRFADFKHRNEWFRKEPELLDYITEHAEDAEPCLDMSREYANTRQREQYDR